MSEIGVRDASERVVTINATLSAPMEAVPSEGVARETVRGRPAATTKITKPTATQNVGSENISRRPPWLGRPRR